MSTKIVGLEVLEQYLLQGIESDEKKFNEKKSSLQHFQGYLDKWDEVDWDLYENFNSKEKKRNVINGQLVPLGEKAKELYKTFFAMRSKKNEMNAQNSKLVSDMENLKNEITSKGDGKREVESKLEYYQNHLKYSFMETEDYRQQLHLNNLEKLTLSDYLPMLEVRYTEKFSMAIEEEYIDKFGVLIRVASVGKRPLVAMVNKTDSEQVKEMIDEAKSAEG